MEWLPISFIDGKMYFLPMVIEESSVVAAASSVFGQLMEDLNYRSRPIKKLDTLVSDGMAKLNYYTTTRLNLRTI